MDILDIDEALKDDSFIFLEDKTHDDVSNILQQWKSNNLIQQQQEQERLLGLNEKCLKTWNRIFSDAQLGNWWARNKYAKSFLQDTSPPASICSSMDLSVDRMNASLVTSADFVNVNFLQSGTGHDFLSDDTMTTTGFHLPTNSYTLSDMIRDRKALESLTLSGDGTLIKDCNIGQIDDISITLSKTASSCSTMNNSTESVEANNRTVEICKGMQSVAKNNSEGILHKTILLSDEMIGDTTLNLIENSIYSNRPSGNAFELLRNGNTEYVETAPKSANETFKKITALDETISLNKINSTFDCQQLTPETNCDTPEADKHATAKKFYESTPQASGISHSTIPSTPSTKIGNDINISPIVAPTSRLSVTRVLSETFDCDPKLKLSDKDKVSKSETFSESSPPQEILEKFPNLNGTFHKSFSRLPQSEAEVAMRNVLSLAQAEADILAQNDDEEEFEQMLDEFSKIELNAEQLKMKKSLDSIKKRFTYGLSEKHERELSREAKDIQEIVKPSTEEQRIVVRSDSNNEKIATVLETGENDLLAVGDTTKSSKLVTEMNASHGEHQKDFKKPLVNSKESPSELSASSSMSASGNCSERLLSRRSRLYDDINISTMPSQARSPGASFKESGEENEAAGILPKNDEILNGEEMVEGSEVVTATTNDSSKNLEKRPRRLVAKRERDRDRFKTVAIVRDRTADAGEDNAERLNVPCIDDMLDDQPEETADVYTEMVQPLQRFSRRDHSSIPSNKTQPNVTDTHEAKPTKCMNYLTYKKPKDKHIETNTKEISTEQQPTSIIAHHTTEPRSLSRPRYISGLQKFSVVSKATSAGDLGRTTEILVPGKQSNLPVNSIAASTSKFGMNALNRKPANVNASANGKKELKSPMGIKSKSFQNLSSNLGAGGFPSQKRNLYGFRPKTSNSSVQQQRILADNQKCDETVFKVPKLVSGIRAPSAIKRAGLARPSSGFYSLNVPASLKIAPPQQQAVETDRHSPTDHTSYESSQSSVHSASSAWKPLSSIPTPLNTLHQLPNAPIPINTGGTGIPKPSGLRPPSNIKHSALPRKSTLLKR